jgi:hypothetical protein
MTIERHRNPALAAAILGLVLNDPEALLFGYALAVSKGDEDSLEIAKFFKKQAEELGVTEDQFKSALNAMKKTSEFMDGAS